MDSPVDPSSVGRTVAYRASAAQSGRIAQQDQQGVRPLRAGARTHAVARRTGHGTGSAAREGDRHAACGGPPRFGRRAVRRRRGQLAARRAGQSRLAQRRPRTDQRITLDRSRSGVGDAHRARTRHHQIFLWHRLFGNDARRDRREVRPHARTRPPDPHPVVRPAARSAARRTTFLAIFSAEKFAGGGKCLSLQRKHHPRSR